MDRPLSSRASHSASPLTQDLTHVAASCDLAAASDDTLLDGSLASESESVLADGPVSLLTPESDAATRTDSHPASPTRKGSTDAVRAPASGRPSRCVVAADPNLHRLASAIASRVGPQRFHVWFDNSTRLEIRNDNLEISVPNDFISEWIGQRFTGTIQEAAVEVFGGPLRLRFQVVPELFKGPGGAAPKSSPSATSAVISEAEVEPSRPTSGKGSRQPESSGKSPGQPVMREVRVPARSAEQAPVRPASTGDASSRATGSSSRLRHDLTSYVVGPGNQLAFNAAVHVAQFPGTQYNPLFIHGGCGLGKTHLIQGLCTRFIAEHPTRKWAYMTGEEFTNDYVQALRGGKVEGFRRRMRDLDLLVIDDVHFLAGKKATQEEFLHTFNAIEALGKQVVMASDSHPKEIAEFGESLVNRFVSGMVVRVDPPNYATRCEILRRLSARQGVMLGDEVIGWVARRVTQNVRELEGAVTRIAAHARLASAAPNAISVELAQAALGDLDRMMVAPVKPESVLQVVAAHFGTDARDLMSGRRHRTVSLARSVAMYLVRKTAKLSYPEIGSRLGKRNHSTVISACRRIEAAVSKNEVLEWSGPLGDRREEAAELLQRLEEHARAAG